MHQPIQAGVVLTKEDQQLVNGAISFASRTLRAFADRHGLSYSRLLRMCDGREAVTPKYADHFNRALEAHRRALSRRMAVATA